MFEFQNIEKTFKGDVLGRPVRAINGLSFKVSPGKMTGFLGANGAGKTTLLKILLRFIGHDKGEVRFDSSLGKDWNTIRLNLGFVPERPYFYPHLSGREFLSFMGRLNRCGTQAIDERAKLWGQRLAIDFALDRKIGGYSKGMLQRIGLLSSLIHDPQVIILDEPLSGLDPIGRHELKRALCELNEGGKTIFFSSHIVSDVEEICQEVVVIEKGELLYQGAIASILEGDGRALFEVRAKKGDQKEQAQDVSLEEKDRLVKKWAQEGYSISRVMPKRMSLEDFVYKVKKQ